MLCNNNSTVKAPFIYDFTIHRSLCIRDVFSSRGLSTLFIHDQRLFAVKMSILFYFIIFVNSLEKIPFHGISPRIRSFDCTFKSDTKSRRRVSITWQSYFEHRSLSKRECSRWRRNE